MNENKNHLITANVVLLNFLTQLTIAIYIPALPTAAKTLQVSDSLIQFSAIAYFLGVGVFSLLNGWLSDQYGRKNIILVALFFFNVGVLLCFFSSNIYLLIAGRFLQGASINCADSVGRPLLADYFTTRELVKKYAYFMMAGPVALLIGLMLGGYITNYFGWEKIFLVLFVVGLSLMVTVWRGLPRSSTVSNYNPCLPKKITDITQNIRFILRNKTFWGFIFPIIAVSGGELAYNLILPFILQVKLNVQPSSYGIILSLVGVGNFLGVLLARFEVKYFSIKQVTLQGLVVCLIMAILLSVIGWRELVLIPMIVLPVVGFSFAAQLIYVNANVGILAPFSKTRVGAACGLQITLQTLTIGILGILLTTFLANTLFNLASFMAMIVLVALISFILLIIRGNNGSKNQKIS